MTLHVTLVGGGGHCVACIDVIEDEGVYRIDGIVDPALPKLSDVSGYPVLGDDSIFTSLIDRGSRFLVTIGQVSPESRRSNVFRKLKSLGAEFATVISPRSYVSPKASVGEGSIIMHDAILNAGSAVGRNCIINTKALIEHDSLVGDHCHIATGAILNGSVQVGDNVFFGSGAVSKHGIKIPCNSFIKAGSVYAGEK